MGRGKRHRRQSRHSLSIGIASDAYAVGYADARAALPMGRGKRLRRQSRHSFSIGIASDA
jgi:hypothetical protein